MPTTATVANSVIAAPPSTGAGMDSTTLAVLGSTPNTIMMTPAAATTQRLLTPVRRTRPTFSENAVYGNELKVPPIMVAMPSARTVAAISAPRTRLPTISAVAKTAPVDSTAVTISTTIRDTTAMTSKRGAPKANGEVNPIQPASPTRVKSVSPASQAMAVPAINPSNTAMVLQKPRKNLCINTISTMVPTAYISQRPLPGSCAATGLCGLRTASPMPTGSSDTPMIVMTEPVTIGGKKRMRRAKNGAMRKVKAPAAMTAP